MDTLLSLLPRFSFNASVFFNGEFCGQNQFLADEGMGHLHLVRKGTVTMEHDSAPSLTVSEPTLVFYPRPMNHRLVVSREDMAVLFCANVRFNHAARNPIALALPDVMCVPLNEKTGLSSTLSLLFAEAAVDDIGKRLIIDHLCDVLVVHLVRHARQMNLIKTGVVAGLSDARLAPVLSAVHTDSCRAWSVEDLAALAHMSRTAFINRFRDIVGLPPAEYLTGWRMELAASYLKEGKSVKEVAQAVGYRYQPGFTKAFSSWYGMPPTQWLKQLG